MPFFSIVIPAYNAEKYIEQTLDTLFNQSISDYEIIVVDDGSTDKTFEIINRHKTRIRVFSQPNQGPGPARNIGLYVASGEYIVSFDSDDLLFPFALEVYYSVIKYFNYPPFIFSRMHYFSGNSAIHLEPSFSRIKCTKHLNFFKKQNALGVSNSNMIIKRESLIKAGGYEPGRTIFDDRGAAFRLGTESPFIQIIEPETVGHRVHPVGLSRNTASLTYASLNIVKNERKNLYPGGKEYKLDRRGIIGANLLFLFKNYFGLRNISDIIKIAFSARFMLLQGIIRKFRTRKYEGESYDLTPNPAPRLRGESS